MQISDLLPNYLLMLFGIINLWSYLRENDNEVYKIARRLQKIHLKHVKVELDIAFLKYCTTQDLLPNFTKWKNFKSMVPKARVREQRRVLRHAYTERVMKRKSLFAELKDGQDHLRSITSPIKFSVIIRAIKTDEECRRKKTVIVHKKKLNALIENKRANEGLELNPNKTIFNLSSHALTNDECNALKLGLKYGIAFRPKEPQLIATVESLWDQIEKNDLVKNDFLKNRVKTALRAFTYSLLDIDSARFREDAKLVKVFKTLKNLNSLVILKPDKGWGCVILNKKDYYDSLNKIFYDTSKFNEVNNDTTLTQLNSLQTFLRKLEKRNEITSEDYSFMRPKFAQPARAHGLPKVHKVFENLPPFRPIVDTTNTVYSSVGKFMSKLLQPLTLNSFTVKDSFDAATRIRNIDNKLINSEGYKFVSFDVTSLFTNVPLDYTVDIILKRIFTNNLLSTTLNKSTLKKLILDSCRKTIFLYNGKYFKQIDGVSMGSSLGPVLSNIIMTELELQIIQPLIDNGIIKFYCRYVDDTLVLIKPENIKYVHDLLNTFHSNIQFTVDTFNDNNVHFLDLMILDNLDIDIYRKSTFTGQYLDYNSFIPWHYKVSWIRGLVNRAKSICFSKSILNKQINFIFNKLMAWNNFPLHVRKTLKAKFLSDRPPKNRTSDEKVTLWLNLPYLGREGEFLINKLKTKLKKSLSVFNLRTVYKTNSISMFCSNKDKMSDLKKANVIYKFKCPGCSKYYIGKTERNLVTRLEEHGKNQSKEKMDAAIKNHLLTCNFYNDILSYFKLFNFTDIDLKAHHIQSVLDNTTILDYNDNWLRLCFLESFYIKRLKPELNTGARASKELKLF